MWAPQPGHCEGTPDWIFWIQSSSNPTLQISTKSQPTGIKPMDIYDIKSINKSHYNNPIQCHKRVYPGQKSRNRAILNTSPLQEPDQSHLSRQGSWWTLKILHFLGLCSRLRTSRSLEVRKWTQTHQVQLRKSLKQLYLPILLPSLPINTVCWLRASHTFHTKPP